MPLPGRFGVNAIRCTALVVLGGLLTAATPFAQVVAAPSANKAGKQDREIPKKPAAPSGPQRVETITYDAWTVTCRDIVGVSDKKTCTATLQVVEPKQRRVVFTWLLGYDPKGTLTAVFQTPVGVQIPRGVEIKLGKAQVRKVNFMTCSSQMCEAAVPLDAALLKEALAAQNAVAVVYAMNGRGLQFNMNLKGIDKALGALQQQ
jgi:invasion protein IalB